MITEQNNPMLCDVEKGICEFPSNDIALNLNSKQASASKIEITYFTDPICSSCWGIEPQLRKLKLEYGEAININYRMGGLLPSWDNFNGGGISKPSDVAHHWDEVSHHYQMPIDGDVWLEDPLSSSYPASIAFLAARLQDNDKAQHYLRRIREMVFMEKKNISKWEFLEQAAIEVGLNTIPFREDFNGKARLLFEQDLKFTKESGVRGFPTLFFHGEDKKAETISGSRPYSVFEQLIQQLNPNVIKNEVDKTMDGVVDHYPTFTTKEFSVITNCSFNEAEKHLTDLYNAGALDRYVTKNGVLWKSKSTDTM